MKTPIFTNLMIPLLDKATSRLSTAGKIALSENNLVYLDIDDAYIHTLFPLLHDFPAEKPPYFGEHSAGAHITLIYPEEHTKIQEADLNQTHHFSVKNIVTTKIHSKTYYVLLVESNSLVELEKNMAYLRN